MKKQIITSIGVILFIILSHAVQAQGYEIKVKIKGLTNQKLILGYHLNDKLLPVDTALTDKTGMAIFKKKKPLVGGMYFIFLPNRNYFDFILGDDQFFTLENDTTDLVLNMKFKDSHEGQVFADYRRFMVENGEKMQKLQEAKQKKSTPEIENQITELNKKFVQYYEQTINDNPNIFFTKFLKATRDVEVPSSITDQMQRYYYYRFHYFDNFDVSDGRLLRTPIYQGKIDTYVDKVLIQHPDTLIKELSVLVEKSRSSEELFRFMLVHLFNKYAKSQLMSAENVYVFLGEIYAKDAKWDTDSFKIQLGQRVAKKKNCLVGKTARNFTYYPLPNDTSKISLINTKLLEFKPTGVAIEKAKPNFDDRRNDIAKLLEDMTKSFEPMSDIFAIKAKYTILWFMDPDCSHCKKETPLLYSYWSDTLAVNYDVQVRCVYLHKDVDEWAKHIDNFLKYSDMAKRYTKNGWKNVWSPFEPFRIYYDIESSPVMYLLDEKKTIIAKRVDYHQVGEIIKELSEGEKKQ